MIKYKLKFPLPEPWKAAEFQIEQFGVMNFLVGPNGSGKTRFAEELRRNLPNSRFLGTDRLSGITKNEGLGIFGEPFGGGLQKNYFQRFKDAGINLGFGIDTFVLLEERPDIRVSVEATLSYLFNRNILLEWDSGNLIPKASLGSDITTTYRIDRDECHGIKELMILLTHLYNDQHPYLIIDEPELNLHPQFQAFFLQEARKFAGEPSPGTRSKVIFLITHSPFMIDIRNVDDLKSVLSFDIKHSIPKTLAEIDAYSTQQLSTLVPSINVYHKQLFFSDNPVFVEGILDARIIEKIQEYENISATAAGSCIIDVGGCGEVNKYLELCRKLDKKAFFLYDLDSLFCGNLRRCIKSETEISEFLAKLGLGSDFAGYCGQLDRKLSALIHEIRGSNDDRAASLKCYLDSLAIDNKIQDGNLRKARLAVLVEIGRSNNTISAIASRNLVSDIQGRLRQIVNALQEVNVILLPGGALEHYLPSYKGCPYHLDKDVKRKAVEDEIQLLAANQDIDLMDRYKELFTCICKLPSKPPVDIIPILKKYLGDYVHELQGQFINNPEWSSDEFNDYFTKASSKFGKLFKVKIFNRISRNEFKAIITVLGPTSMWETEVSNDTNAGMRKFSLKEVSE